MRSYTTPDKIKKYMGIDFTTGLDDFVKSMIESASAYVERYCGDQENGLRIFEAPTTEETRYFDGNDKKYLNIGDVQSVSSVVSYNTALTESEDFHLYPLNARAFGQPYTSIELIQPEGKANSASTLVGGSPYVFETGQRRHSVTGIFAYSEAPPAEIALATLKLTAGIIKENIGDKDLREVSSENIGSYSVSFQAFQNIANALSVEELLKPYTRGNNEENGMFVVGNRLVS